MSHLFDGKQLLARVHEQQFGDLAVPDPDPALSAGPQDAQSSTEATLTCPCCGGTEARLQQVRDAEVELSGEEDSVLVATCPECTAEFCPPGPPASAAIVVSALGERSQALRRLGAVPLEEALPLAWELSR